MVKNNLSLKKSKGLQAKEGLLTSPLVKHRYGNKWYEYATDERTSSPNKENDIEKLEMKAETLYKRDVELFNQMQELEGVSEVTWIATVLKKGTAADKITALQLLVRRSPVHSCPHIGSLVNVIEKRNIRESFSVLGIIKNLFMNELLPHNRKLIPFSSRPINEFKKTSTSSSENAERRLILWKFESDLKVIYGRFINAIEKLAGSAVEKVGSKVCHDALDLLAECPEQEQKLLSLLINKLGHPNHKLATKVCSYLVELTHLQPKMRGVIISEVERLIYRKNISGRTQLYAASFLSQIQLKGGEYELATQLLKIYFGFFRMLVIKGKMDDKILSILLSATNRAYPFTVGHTLELEVEVDLLYKVLHQSNFATSLQTFKLLSQLSSGNENDRFYKALYRRMLFPNHSPLLQNQLLTLIYHVLKADSDSPRVIAFIKRLLQLSITRSAEFAAASLLMIARLTSERPDTLMLSKSAQKSYLSVQQKTVDSEDEYFEDVKEENNVNDAGISKENLCKGSWIHAENIVLRSDIHAYDRNARNPSYAKGEFSVFSELLLLRNHYHPSVSLFASNILKGAPVEYDGDPLVDLTAMRFFDRFAYRNPKRKDAAAKNVVNKVFRRKAYDPLGIKKLPITSKEYSEKKEDEIPIDERYLHRFATFSMKREQIVDKKVDGTDDNSDAESVNSDEFELILNRVEADGEDVAFDIDFAKEFSTEKRSRKAKKRNAAGELEEEEEEDEDEISEDDLDDDDTDDENEEDEKDDDFDDEDDDITDSLENEVQEDSDIDYSSDGDFAEKMGYTEDAAISADKVDEIMDEEENWTKSKHKILKRRKRGRRE